MNNGPIMAMTPLMQENSLDYDKENGDVNLALAAKSMSTPKSSSTSTEADDTDDNREAADTIRLLKEAERVLDSSGSERRDLALQDNKHGAYHGGNNFGAVEAGGGDVRGACWTECLVPMRLLSKHNVRGILFTYGLVSVSPYVAPHAKMWPDCSNSFGSFRRNLFNLIIPR